MGIIPLNIFMIFMNDIPLIGKTFEKLLANPDIDSDGYCVEMYIAKDVRCMDRLK